MDKYEISLWEDFVDVDHFDERKLAVIGSDTMTDQVRALEPKLVENIDGTNIFSFKMYYTYSDIQTGVKYSNPFAGLLVNERKVKVYWKNKWYDFIIKDIKEDSTGRSAIYTCKDLFINELSKSGYNLEFSSELMNNTGTVEELATEVLHGSGWSYDKTSDKLIQEIEEPIYEVYAKRQFTTIEGVTILADKKLLLYYSVVSDITNPKTFCQFLYSANGYATENNEMLVTNGQCLSVNVTWSKVGDILHAYLNNNEIFEVSCIQGTSLNYRAKRKILSQKTVYNQLLDRYVNLYSYNNHTIYGYETTQYNSPEIVVNLISNPENYTGTEGWVHEGITFGIFPKFTRETSVVDYEAYSYIYFPSGITTNNGIAANQQYVDEGFQVGEKYIFRIQAFPNVNDAPDIDHQIYTSNLFSFNASIDNTVYLQSGEGDFKDGWLEYPVTCIQSCPKSQITDLVMNINCSNGYWIKNIQFFKEVFGYNSYTSNTKVRINPGEMEKQSIIQTVYKYFEDNSHLTDVDDMIYLYIGTEPWPRAEPLQNNYEKICTIEGKESNRFNLLQNIAESFQCWVRFNIEHEENGKIKLVNGVPQKFIKYVQEVGTDTGLNFEYGIDLKTINRTIDSTDIVTKVIVNQNENEFAKNGFCTIARARDNYPKESFILNMDYYLIQGLLDKEKFNNDLYSWSGSNLGYYYYLHSYNKQYDDLAIELAAKNTEISKQESLLIVYKNYVEAANQEMTQIKADLEALAGATSWEDAWDYVQAHANDSTVASLMNAHERVRANKATYDNLVATVSNGLEKLKSRVSTILITQKNLLNQLSILNSEFYKRYSRYIQEGSWQSDDYIDDNQYYLDALSVAYESSRPKITYTINVLRLSALEEYMSKVFNLGDICGMIDREFFGYKDEFTPYAEKVLVSEITSYFDTPEKDVLKIQNYKSQFDDLFQRITATTQQLSYATGLYAKTAGIINPDGTINATTLQQTLDENGNIIYTTSNQGIIMNGEGILLSDTLDANKKTKITSNGILVSADGGATWAAGVTGEGINTSLLKAGSIDVDKIVIMDGAKPSFRWDNKGLNSYVYDENGNTDTSQFVRFDKFGIYGMENADEDFVPANEDAIFEDPRSKFGMTWNRFFMKNQSGSGSIEITSDGYITIKQSNIERIKIGRLNSEGTNYGIIIKNQNGENIFTSDNTGSNIAGWNLNSSSIFYGNNSTGVKMNSDGTFECKVDGATKWKLDNQGKGTFHDIFADYGTIAGWTITEGGIYNYDGTSITPGGQYNISTSKLYCTGGSIGGCSVGGGGISGAGWNINANGADIPINALTANGVKMYPYWDSITYLNNQTHLALYIETVRVYTSWATTGSAVSGFSTYWTDYIDYRCCTGWAPSTMIHYGTGKFLRGSITPGSYNP